MLDFLAGTDVVGVALDAEEDAVGFVSAMTMIFLNLFLIKYKKFEITILRKKNIIPSIPD
ncbi:MAG: hypothetical protein NVSMB45_08220 [Ginsengibacter sp.]